MGRARRWKAVFQDLPVDHLPADLATWVQNDDSESVIAYLEERRLEATEDERAFYDQSAHARSLQEARHHRKLHDDELAEVEWYSDGLSQRQARSQLLRDRLRLAKDIAGVEPHEGPESDDDPK